MYIIISGAGDVGLSIAESLTRVGHDITIIEKKKVNVDRARALDVRIYHGDGGKMEVLDSAQIDMAEFYFGVTNDDEANMLGCVIAKSRGVKTIARLNNLSYINEPVSMKFSSIGIDIAVCPKLLVVEKIMNIISIPALMNRTAMAKGKMMLLEAKIDHSSSMCRKKLGEINLPKGILVGGIFRGIKVIIPEGKTRIKKGDRLLLVLDSPDKIHNIRKLVGRVEGNKGDRTDDVMIIGVGDMAIHLARRLERKNINVTLISDNIKRCKRAASILKDSVVINGDPTDKKLILEEGLKEMDAVVAMTRKEGINVLVSLLAKVYKIPKVISLINKTSMKGTLETIGIDLALSIDNLTVEALLREIGYLGILKTIPLYGGDVIVFETKVGKRSSVKGKKINKIKLPRGVLIIGVLRGGNTVIPGGDFKLEKRDRVLLFCYQEMMEQMDRYFKGKGLII